MNKAFMFVLGAAAGSLLTWKIVEGKYKKLAEEEIEAVREHYKKKNEKALVEHYVETNEIDNTKKEYTKQVTDLGYTSTEVHEVYLEPGVDIIEPFVISPDEYGEKDYEVKSWTYYSDFVLADDDGEIVSEPENIIGDALSHFGDYEEDSVFVRNENLEWDIEILKHEKTFSEINEEDN